MPAGCGIILALAREFITLHHGTIAARSEGPGRGSEFIVKLPLHERQESAVAMHVMPVRHASLSEFHRISDGFCWRS